MKIKNIFACCVIYGFVCCVVPQSYCEEEISNKNVPKVQNENVIDVGGAIWSEQDAEDAEKSLPSFEEEIIYSKDVLPVPTKEELSKSAGEEIKEIEKEDDSKAARQDAEDKIAPETFAASEPKEIDPLKEVVQEKKEELSPQIEEVKQAIPQSIPEPILEEKPKEEKEVAPVVQVEEIEKPQAPEVIVSEDVKFENIQEDTIAKPIVKKKPKEDVVQETEKVIEKKEKKIPTKKETPKKIAKKAKPFKNKLPDIAIADVSARHLGEGAHYEVVVTLKNEGAVPAPAKKYGEQIKMIIKIEGKPQTRQLRLQKRIPPHKEIKISIGKYLKHTIDKKKIFIQVQIEGNEIKRANNIWNKRAVKK